MCVRIYCLVFFLGCSKIIPYSWDLKNAAGLIGKVGPAISNRCLQKTRSILTSTVIARGVTRKLLQEGQLRKPLFSAGRPKKYCSVLRRSASLPLIVLCSGRKTIQMAKGLGAAATLRNAYGNQNWENAEQPHGALLLWTVSEPLNMKDYFQIFGKKNVKLSLSWVDHQVLVNHLRSCFEAFV